MVKLRNGFVSNSSSASYIVDIEITLEILVQEVRQSDPWRFSGDFFKRTVIEQIEHCYEMADLSDEECITKDSKKKAQEFEEMLLIFDKLSDVERTVMMLNLYGINVELFPTIVRLKSFTSMHNSYDDGLCEPLKEFILFLLFYREGKYNLKCRSELDHDGLAEIVQ